MERIYLTKYHKSFITKPVYFEDCKYITRRMKQILTWPQYWLRFPRETAPIGYIYIYL